MALDLSYIGSFFVERFQFFKKVTLSFLFLSLSLFASSLLANQGSQEITIDGTLYGDTGFSSPLLDPSATFKLQVLDPTKNCVLYEETQVVNTTTTSGRYNLRVGSLTGAGKRSGDDPNHAMIDIFQNVSALAATNAGCPGSTYTPSSGDGRFLRVTVTPSSTGVPETMSPDLALTSVANALVCESVQGLDRDKLAEFGTHINAAMTAANLLKLFDGSDVASLHNHDGEYAKLSNSNSIDLGTQQTIGFGEFTTAQETTLTGSLGAGDAGKTWYNSTTNKLMYWDGSAAQEIGSGGGSGAVTSVFGRTGVVTAAASDYDADQVDNTPAGNISATNVQAAITELDNEKLALSGGTMSGIINMNDNNLDMGTGTAKIVDLADPTNAQDAATKAYVDSAISTSGGSFVAKAGDTMTGALAMGTNKVTGVGDPTAAQDVATKNYVDTKLIGQALPSSPSTGQNGQALRWNNSGGAWEYYTPASGGLSDVVNDTTPQLGGTLDINGQNMSTATGLPVS